MRVKILILQPAYYQQKRHQKRDCLIHRPLKKIDWSKLDIDEEADEEAGSADSFFQKLYAGADPDTKRAMMKSFIESNGTALSTDWEDVSKGTVKTSPPEGMEPKHW